LGIDSEVIQYIFIMWAVRMVFNLVYVKFLTLHVQLPLVIHDHLGTFVIIN
jgi:hypothetical protein